MTLQEFTSEVKKLEAAKGVPIARSTEEVEYRDLRRLAIFELVEQFPVSVLREARIRLCGSDGSDNPRYFPNVDEIVEVCEEVVEESKPKAEFPKSKFAPVGHLCGPKPEPSPALDELKILSAFGAPGGYEAEHILCPGEIPATCPSCGAGHIEVDVFADLIQRYPKETANWNPCFKGLMLCDPCSKKSQ